VARGNFDVEMTAHEMAAQFHLLKKYRGDLVATATGEMLTVRTSVEGSAAYVAIEVVTGKMAGLSGSFTVVHRGVMDRSVQELSVTIVPDSGTDELTGIGGSMDIQIVEGQHQYVMTYSLPDQH
ncbi:MAG: DUF3224 domain-containing protein, partial [Gammaproteobacteria bacterium]|nr:DUF3224 domain-containing protein [Gammaproteobacteria bacterium]